MLKNKVALITGAGQGIGAATVRAFAQNHACVVLNYRSENKVAKARQIQQELQAKGYNVALFHGDISKPEEAQAMVDFTVHTYGKIDILVNNAAMGLSKDSALDFSRQEVHDVIDTNIMGTYTVTRAALDYMLKQQYGRIINLSSTSVLQPRGGSTAYCMSKAGIELMTKAMAQEFGPQGVHLNYIVPGPTETEMMRASFTEERLQSVIQTIPTRKTSSVEDIANAILFLASSMADNITGQGIVIDGGRTIR